MLIYAGIDEAGYGPLLGPLCVAASVFELRDHDPAAGSPNLWETLQAAICRSGEDRSTTTAARIAIDDSKKLKGSNTAKTIHPLKKLERGVLSFQRVTSEDNEIANDNALFARLGCKIPPHHWYDRSQPTALPLANAADSLKIDIASLNRQLHASNIVCHRLVCEAIDPADYNTQIARMGSKAAINACAVIRLVDQIWKQFPGQHPRIIVDRLGGRIRYRELLQQSFPDAQIQIVAEHQSISRYILRAGSRAITISFMVDADQKHLPVALASMTAKFTRELMMARLNAFFKSHLPELKPTAGYYQDGRRFLEDINELMHDLKIDRSLFVRNS